MSWFMALIVSSESLILYSESPLSTPHLLAMFIHDRGTTSPRYLFLFLPWPGWMKAHLSIDELLQSCQTKGFRKQV
ncbi:hypothetical protein BDR06DRAFT_960908, partial [Suillus hirtellus]